MASEARSLSLPSLHNIQRQRGKISDRSKGGSGSFRLPSSPSTPSTSASSRSRLSAITSCRSTTSSSGSWGANADRTRQHACEGVSFSRSNDDSLCPSLPRSPFKPLSTKTDFPLLRTALQTLRPDEELLQSVRTHVEFADSDSVVFIYEMIQSGQDINQRSERGFTPLAVAAAAGSEALVSLLLEKNADVMIASTDRAELPLHYAAFLGHHVICHLVLSVGPAVGMLDAASSVGWTALHLAAVTGHEKTVRTLLRFKANPDRTNSVFGGHSAIHLAALGGHAEVLESLLEHEGDANLGDTLRRTPLHMAAMRADAACVALLLRYHADPLRRGGDRNNAALELVPTDRANSSSERTRQLLSAYIRQAPAPLRTDDRFDLPGGHDILSAYKYPVPWGLSSSRRQMHSSNSQTFDEWREEDEDAVWL